ncbi:MAG: trigger factor [Patescibacteria group bacterium]
MDIKVESKENSKKELKVTIPLDEFEEYVDKAAQNLSEDMDIKGFRPGNAPRDVVENSVGKEKVWQEAARIAVEKTYPKALEEKDLFAISQPEVDFAQLAPGNDLVYKASFYTMPEFDLPNYKEIAEKIVDEKKEDVEVEDSEVDETLERIQDSRATSKEVDREASEGDQVTVSFTGEVDGEKRIEEDEFGFELGSGQFSTLEGFEDEIVGMKAGEDKDFSVSIPEDSSNKELAGKEIDFNLKLDSVSEKELPELTDEFAESLHPNVSSLKELREKIKEGIQSEKESKNEEALKMEIVQALIENTDFPIPDVLVERELNNMETKMERQLQQSGVTFEDYLDQIDKTKDDLRDEWRSKAEDNVSAAIILHKIAEAEEIEVTNEEIEEEVQKHLSHTGQSAEEHGEEDLQRLRSYIRDIKKNDKIFNFLMN